MVLVDNNIIHTIAPVKGWCFSSSFILLREAIYISNRRTEEESLESDDSPSLKLTLSDNHYSFKTLQVFNTNSHLEINLHNYCDTVLIGAYGECPVPSALMSDKKCSNIPK